MDNLILSFKNVFIFVLLALPGYILIKKKVMKMEHVDGLSILLVNLLWPAMVIDAMSSVTINKELFDAAITTIVISTALYVIGFIATYLIYRGKKLDIDIMSVIMFGVAFNNTGLIGMPFIKIVFGNEALFIASIIEGINDIFIFTLGLSVMKKTKTSKGKMDLKGLLSPGFIGVIVGLIIFFANIDIPNVIRTPIQYLSQSTTALAMFIVGAQLGEINIVDVFKEKRAFLPVFLRIVIVPFIMFVTLYYVVSTDDLVAKVNVLMSAMPVATATAIFSRQYGKDIKLATAMVVISTVLEIIALPAWLYVLNSF